MGSVDQRLVVPDLSRGLLLLLIAIANISYFFPAAAWDPHYIGVAERWVVIAQTVVIDHAVYPLFAILLGFGMGRLAERYVAGDGEPENTAVRKLRIRGAVLMGFGAALGLVFGIEILGTYGVVTVLVARIAVRRQRAVMLSVGVSVVVMNLLWAGVLARWGSVGETAEVPLDQRLTFNPMVSLPVWAVNTLSAIPLSLVVPAVLLGVWISKTEYLSAVERYRRQLLQLVLTGVLGAAVSAPMSLYLAGFSAEVSSLEAVFWVIGNFATAVGWLAIMGLLSTYPRVVGSKGGQLVRGLGRASLSGYVAQVLLMTAVMSVVAMWGAWSNVGVIHGWLIAVTIWVLTLFICEGLQRMGHGAPLERVMRAGVRRWS